MEYIFGHKKIPNDKIIFENELAYAIFDTSPVSKGHMLIISKRVARTFFDLTKEEQIGVIELLDKCKLYLDREYNPDGYNVGLNCEEAAGQTYMHIHMHIIPRYIGDIDNPRGGIRAIIPSKKEY